MNHAPPAVPRQFLRLREQASFLGVHPKTVSRLAARDETFPREFLLSEGVRVRSLAELEAWVRSKREGKRGGKPRKPKPEEAAP